MSINVSFCTVCMNRLPHLRRTLVKNIEQNKALGNVEFVLLDYNSGDGLENWVESNLMEYIQQGILKYYKTYEPIAFKLSHSKNMSLRLAKGNILCMVDADNFAGDGYAEWVASVYEAKGTNTIITTLRREDIPYRDQGGKLCFSRELLHSINGFDESLVGYGVEDVDLVRRAEQAGGKRYFLDHERFLYFIGHSMEERLKHHAISHLLKDIYLLNSKGVKERMVLLLLFKDNTFTEVTFNFDHVKKDHLILSYKGWVIKENADLTGVYSIHGKELELHYQTEPTKVIYKMEVLQLKECNTQLSPLVWTRIRRRNPAYLPLLMAFTECFNRRIYLRNEMNGIQVNRNGWGTGTVYLNFDKSNPIVIK